MSPFGQYDSPALLGEQMMEREDILSRRNKLATELAGGAYQRQSYASQGRILPFSEQMAIASAQLGQQQALGSIENLPQAQEARRVSQEYDIARARQGIQDIPAEAEYEQKRRAAAMEQFGTDDPNIRKLQSFARDPQTLLAYESFLDDPATAGLPSQQRRKIAYLNALGMEQDRQAVEAIDFELQSNPNANAANRGKFIEPVFDPATGAFIGERISKTADRGKVAELIAKARNQKRLLDIEKEKRIASESAQKFDLSNKRIALAAIDKLTRGMQFDDLPEDEKKDLLDLQKQAAGLQGEQKAPEEKKVFNLFK